MYKEASSRLQKYSNLDRFVLSCSLYLGIWVHNLVAHKVHKNRIEAVQDKFVTFLGLRLPCNVRNDKKLTKTYIGLSLLETRCEFVKICFMFKIWSNMSDFSRSLVAFAILSGTFYLVMSLNFPANVVPFLKC